MIKNYRGYAYFDNNPEIVKIFEDLEAFQDHCRMEMLPFNEADLYNKSSWVWRHYEKKNKPKPAFANERPERKPYLGKNPRY